MCKKQKRRFIFSVKAMSLFAVPCLVLKNHAFFGRAEMRKGRIGSQTPEQACGEVVAPDLRQEF